jgi:hypothetical protein
VDLINYKSSFASANFLKNSFLQGCKMVGLFDSIVHGRSAPTLHPSQKLEKLDENMDSKKMWGGKRGGKSTMKTINASIHAGFKASFNRPQPPYYKVPTLISWDFFCLFPQ